MDSTPSKRRRITASPSRSVRTLQPQRQEDEASRRTSYRAPTQASISRFNPQLLSGRARSDESDGEAEPITRQTQGQRNPAALRPKMTAPRLSASPMRETSSSPSRRAQTTRESIDIRRNTSLSGPRRSVSEAEDRDEQNAETQVQEEAERSLMEEEKLAEAVMRKPKRYRDNVANFAPELLRGQQEPELPPTPVQLGLEKQPRLTDNLTSDSPGERELRRRAVPKRSPMKLDPETSEQASRTEEIRNASPKEVTEPTSEQIAKDATVQNEEELADDPKIIEQRKRLDDLAKQLSSLRSDVSFLLSQVRQSQGAGRQSVSLESTHRLVSILAAKATSDTQESSPLKSTTLATRLSAFLPFSKKPKPLPEDPLLEEEILPSYRPVEESNPLINLQAFTPFTITSAQQLVSISSTEALLNRQQIRLSSPTPVILDLEFQLLSDTDTDTLEQLSLDSISPWADAELGSWIRQQAEDTVDMASIGWGSSRYLEVAKARARCWARCHREFPQYVSTALGSISSQPNARLAKGQKSSDGDLSQYLGRPSLQLQSRLSKASLLITWHITLDWIGDTESRVSASASLPTKWTRLDSQRKSLAKIPEAFEKLVKKTSVFEAIQALIDIVLGVEQ